MKKFVFILLVIALGSSFSACRKKEKTLAEMQEPLSMEALSKITAVDTSLPALPEPKAPAQATRISEQAAFESLAPAQTLKPTNIEIQTALKNAGYYAGPIDGRIGPLTKEAIEKFQKDNNLKSDGKVGPKTWAVLSSHLNPKPQAPAKKKR